LRYIQSMSARFSLKLLTHLLVLVCLQVYVASADTPVPFGLPVQYRDAEPVLGFGGGRDVSELASVNQAQATLEKTERRLGPYHPSLAGEFVQVAQLAMEAGDVVLAASLYNAALYNARVNNGLYGDQQLPILRGLLDLHLLAGDRESFEARAAYQFRLLGSGLPPFEEGELRATLEFFDVSLDALMGVSWEGRGRELLVLHTRFESMAEAVCADASVNLAWCEPFTFSLGRFYYLLEHKLDVFVDHPRFERTFSDPKWQSLDREPRLEALQRRLFTKGETVFERLLEVNPDSPEALSALADWHWFYRKRDEATSLYRRACRLSPSRFTQPAPLPQYPRLAFNRAFQKPAIPLDVSLTVTERGKPVDMNFSLPAAGADADPPGRIRRAMRSMVYRPAFMACSEPVERELQLELAFVD
jgi:tetratricopeptide (TPR) repeat protein